MLVDRAPELSSLAALAFSASTTVVRLNYRLARNRKYPGPIHDVLAGYDWIAKHLVRSSSHQRVAGLQQGSIGVCGELIGGSLAAALALTECHSTKTGVKALAMGNPISDWTVMQPVLPSGNKEAQLASILDKSTKKRTARPSSWERNANDLSLSSSVLLKARTDFFKSPEDYFDPFASPTHFFRSPSVSVPGIVDPLDEIFLDVDIQPQQETKKRRSHRRYPPLKSSLRLPDTKLMVGQNSVLMDQAIDLAEGIARSNHSHGGPSGTGEGTGWERVDVEVRKGNGWWSETDLVELGAWFQEKLKD